MTLSDTPMLDRVAGPADLRRMEDRDLSKLAGELRQELISVVSKTGGHLGSSLGVVELTVAIHAVFNTPMDKLIWDVSHQCYPHKILTGRRDRIRRSGRRMDCQASPSALNRSSTRSARRIPLPRFPQRSAFPSGATWAVPPAMRSR